MKKLIFSLVVAMALIGAVYGAAAALTVGGVDSLGSGTSDVLAPGGGTTLSITDVSWILNATDVTEVKDIIVKVANSTGGDDEGTCTLTISLTGVTFVATETFDGPAANDFANVIFSAVGLDAALIDGELAATIICETT